MTDTLSGWTLKHPPSGEARWQDGAQTWVSTGDELWEISKAPRVWPIQDVDALVAEVDAVLVRSEGVRQRLDRESPSARCRQGLHRTAQWTPIGWQINGLALPYGARWSSSLMPTATGVAAVWTTEAQHFECTVLGVRAVRERDERWWTRTDAVPEMWAVAQAERQLWGPGGRLWNLTTGESQSLPGWTGGVAAARGTSAVVVNALTGEGIQFDTGVAKHTFTVPLRRDMAAELTWEDNGPLLTTELGKQFSLTDGHVRKLPGRVVVEESALSRLECLGIAIDGVTRVGDADWAWRQDGLLLCRNGFRRTV
ncbi:MAG: hypothetical protein ACJAZO_003578 [Myxococcota bacterium]|jgi:hypothetical protein